MFRLHLVIILAFLVSITATHCSSANSGSFLASQFSASLNDFKNSAMYRVDMIRKGEKGSEIYNDALLFLIAAGNFEEAYSLADTMVKLGLKSPALALTIIIEKIKNKKFDQAIVLISKFDSQLPTFLKASMKGWIYIQKNNLNSAFREFESFRNSNLNFDLGVYYTAIAHAQLGDYSKSSDIIRRNIKNLEVLGKNFELFKADVLNLSGDKINAELSIVSDIKNNSNSLTFKQLYNKIKYQKAEKLDFFKHPNSGIADTLLLFAEGDGREAKQNLVETFYCQLANHISDNEARFNVRLAEALAEADLFSEAINSLMSVSKSDLYYPEAKLMLADLLTESNQEKKAIKELKNLLNDGVKNFEVYEALGNVYRYAKRFKLADLAYSDALALSEKSDLENRKLWLTYFFRGIVREQLREYDQSMIDLRKALELLPEQPQVLNYLGYMLIERGQNLEEALDMIKLAVNKSPQSGYIIDSLAWGLFQLGRYEEAISPMEKAIALEPEDPIVNDHFGDILWKVGRKREAYFQWRRALFFQPEEESQLSIEKKLQLGLEDSLTD